MRGRRRSGMLWGALVGAGLGLGAQVALGDHPALDVFLRYVAQPVGQVFLRLLFMLVVPLIVSALALGVAGLGDLRSLGRIGAKTLAYTVIVSAISVLLGLAAVNLLRPGDTISPALRERLVEGAAERTGSLAAAPAPAGGLELLIGIVPDNPLRAAAEGQMLAVIFFALMLGIGIALSDTPATGRFAEALQGLFDVSMRLLELVLLAAPVGVAALLFDLTAQLGLEALAALGRYVGIVVLALAVHQFGVYSLLVSLVGRTRPGRFFRAVQPAMVTAFSTASSNATLPTALRVAEESLRLPREIGRFVLTIGATANQNGTALFEGVTVLFLAQLYGVELSLAQQGLVLLICILGGIGTAGVPAGSIPVVAMILGMIGVPVEGIALVLGVDRFLDMCRTTVNVTGDLAVAVAVARGEREPTDAAAAP